MIKLFRLFSNSSDEDTALDATRGLPKAKPVRILYRACLLFVTMTAITLGGSAFSASTETKPAATNKPPHIALASSFRSLWPTLMHAYIKSSGSSLPLTSFASSGLLSTQILRGAPFELFISADLSSITRIKNAGKTLTPPYALARGTLSLVSLPTHQSSWGTVATMDSLRELIKSGNSLKIAIPNPRHAPYGIAAQQALQAAGLWPLPKGSLLNAENASQALQYVLSGAADIAIVPTTLVTRHTLDITVSSIDPASYEPVIHHLVLLAQAGEQAQQLYAWMKSSSALKIMQQFGLSAP